MTRFRRKSLEQENTEWKEKNTMLGLLNICMDKTTNITYLLKDTCFALENVIGDNEQRCQNLRDKIVLKISPSKLEL